VKGEVIGSTFVVVAIGSLLHFAWEWSGRSSIVAIVAAVNESTWEHLKMAFWPSLILSPFQWRFHINRPGWLPATAISALLPPVLIVVLFYGYTWVVGSHHLWADIATFVVAVFIGQLLGHVVTSRHPRAGVRVASAAALVIGFVAFSTLSFTPPSWFLFDDPRNGMHPNSRTREPRAAQREHLRHCIAMPGASISMLPRCDRDVLSSCFSNR
jgi:hypothetical protein